MNLPWRGKNGVETVLLKSRIVTDEHRLISRRALLVQTELAEEMSCLIKEPYDFTIVCLHGKAKFLDPIFE